MTLNKIMMLNKIMLIIIMPIIMLIVGGTSPAGAQEMPVFQDTTSPSGEGSLSTRRGKYAATIVGAGPCACPNPCAGGHGGPPLQLVAEFPQSVLSGQAANAQPATEQGTPGQVAAGQVIPGQVSIEQVSIEQPDTGQAAPEQAATGQAADTLSMDSGTFSTDSGTFSTANGTFPLDVHGFLLGAFTGRTTGEQPAESKTGTKSKAGDFVLGEERLRLELSANSESGQALFLIKSDIFHDSIDQKTDTDLREAYVGYTQGPMDLQLGRQILTWGVGDLFFINDVFPKDWDSFYSGRPMEYLKLGVDGLRSRYSSAAINAEFLIIPSFTPDTMPSQERFFFYNPFSDVLDQQKAEPESTYSHTELALRLYRQVADFDLSLYAYRGFWHSPSLRVDNPVDPKIVTQFYPALSVYGFSSQRTISGGVFSLEAGYYDSRSDRPGDDPTIPNSQYRYLAGYQYQLWQDFTAGLQVYGEYMVNYGAYRDYLPSDAPIQDRNREVISARLTQFLKYQTWKISGFFAYSPTDQDYFLQPEISYKINDSLSLSGGANVFGGDNETTFFGQFDKSDNIYINARFNF